MELITISPPVMAAFFLRVILGVLFFIQGYDKVIKIGVKGVIDTVGPAYSRLGFPSHVIRIISYFTSWAELMGGALLIVGLFSYPAVVLLGIDLLIVTVGLTMLDPVHDLRVLFPRILFLILYLMFAAGIDVLTLDSLITG